MTEFFSFHRAGHVLCVKQFQVVLCGKLLQITNISVCSSSV